MLNIKIVSWSLGIFTAISFVLCVIYGLIVPPSMHYMAPFLEMALPAFVADFGGFCLGLIESFHGAYAGLVFAPIYNFSHPPVGWAGKAIVRFSSMATRRKMSKQEMHLKKISRCRYT